MSFVLSAEMYNEIQNSKTIRQQILDHYAHIQDFVCARKQACIIDY